MLDQARGLGSKVIVWPGEEVWFTKDVDGEPEATV